MIRLAIRVAPSDAEIVLAELLELAPSGVEESEVGDGRVEYAVYGWPGELPDIPAVRAAAGGVQVEVSSSEVADDWDERWKRFHRPALIAAPTGERVPSVHLRPPWEPARSAGTHTAERHGPIEIVIDPGRAFGTGGHATTRLCLELMLELAASRTGGDRGAMIDVGTGSGVLAIAAAKLGYEPLVACDNDPDSVHAAARNASANGVSVDVRRLDIRAETIPWPADRARGHETVTIVANLLRPLLLELAPRLPAAPADLLAGGLLVSEVDEVVDVYAKRWGMVERDRRREGDWAAVWLQGVRDAGGVGGGRAAQGGRAVQAEPGGSVAARTIER